MSNDELYDLIDEVQNKIPGIIFRANRVGNLDDLLLAMGLEDLCQKQSFYETYKDGKIVVIGQSEISKDILLKVAKKLKIDESRFEFNLEYDDAIHYQYEKLRYNPNYRVVMFGPVPHKTTGTIHNESAIAELENHDGYPRVIRLKSSDSLKITKTSFKNSLLDLQQEGFI